MLLVQVVLKVAITCKNCMSDVLSVISKVKGIKSMDIDSEKNVLTVVGNMDVMKIVAALRKAKYAAELVSATNTDG
nr:unnamed protein product [Digitaria exilis]